MSLIHKNPKYESEKTAQLKQVLSAHHEMLGHTRAG